MGRVSRDDLLLAAEWLDYNEGADGERETCERVANWLRAEAEKRNVRNVAQAYGISMQHARRAIEKARESR
jgi:response regulator of citrate/malate metabolism